MDILHHPVNHKKNGNGLVIKQDAEYITVRFSNKEVSFQYPQAFEKFLTHADEDIQSLIIAEIEQLPQSSPFMYNIPTIILPINPKHRQSHEVDAKNIAFKCNYCDGGCSSNGIGYSGMCSDETIKYNIEVKKHAWCSFPESPCYKYYSNQLSKTDLNDSFVCYEAEMLINWKAQAGVDHKTANKPEKGRRIAKAGLNKLAVLTTVMPGDTDQNRIIFGVFIIGKINVGDSVQCGSVEADKNYCIALTKDEAMKMHFWHYYKNKNNPEKAQWGQGLYRYLDDYTCARILADIVNIKSDIKEKENAQNILAYFCTANNIDINNIPPANGFRV